jgi:hypothetical protein
LRLQSSLSHYDSVASGISDDDAPALAHNINYIINASKGTKPPSHFNINCSPFEKFQFNSQANTDDEYVTMSK